MASRRQNYISFTAEEAEEVDQYLNSIFGEQQGYKSEREVNSKGRLRQKLAKVEEFAFEEREVVAMGLWHIDHATLEQLLNMEDLSSFAQALRQKYLLPGERLRHMVSLVSNMLKSSVKEWKIREAGKRSMHVEEPSILTRSMRVKRKLPVCYVDDWAHEQEEIKQGKRLEEINREFEIDRYLFPGQWDFYLGDYKYSPTWEEIPDNLPFQTDLEIQGADVANRIYKKNKRKWFDEGRFIVYSESPLLMLREIANRASFLAGEEVAMQAAVKVTQAPRSTNGNPNILEKSMDSGLSEMIGAQNSETQGDFEHCCSPKAPLSDGPIMTTL